MAIDAMIVNARVKRARFAFTVSLLELPCVIRPATGLPWGGPKIPGFGSPPHDGFALDGSFDGGRLSSSIRTLFAGSIRANDPLVPFDAGVRGRFRHAPPQTMGGSASRTHDDRRRMPTVIRFAVVDPARV
jgi:hypothetical protein